jgi:DNA-directed RNA polymerase subunit beta
MELETRKNDFIILKFNRKRTVPITVFLRCPGNFGRRHARVFVKEGSDEEILVCLLMWTTIRSSLHSELL